MFALMYTENAENPTRSTILIFEKMIYGIFDCVELIQSINDIAISETEME